MGQLRYHYRKIAENSCEKKKNVVSLRCIVKTKDMEKNKKKKYEKPAMKVVKLAQKRQALLNGTPGGGQLPGYSGNGL